MMFELDSSITFLDLQNMQKSGKTCSVELVKNCLEMIEQDRYNCVLEVNPDALKIAQKMDELRKNGKVLSPLHGVPVMIKGNIDTSDKMATSAGSVALQDNYPAQDAPIVEKLREAGAVIVAKTNMAEFANYMADGKMPNGYSSLGGQVICAVNPKLNPSGSSSGSAVAVSIGMCLAAVGTETFGSITTPSIRNQIIGIKPTQGLVNNAGIIPISHTLDTAGPMASNVINAALLLTALAEDKHKKDYLPQIDKLKIGDVKAGFIFENHYNENSKSRVQYAGKLIKFLQDNQCTTLELEKMPATTLLDSLELYEFKHDINQYLQKANHKTIKTLQDIIDYNNAHAEAALKYGQHRLLYAQTIDDGIHSKKYQSILKQRRKIQEFLFKLFDEKQLDFIITTSSPNVAVMSGFPIISVPLGINQRGFPQGVYIFARPFAEDKLIQLAYFIEKNYTVK